jgi:hypothetical protein
MDHSGDRSVALRENPSRQGAVAKRIKALRHQSSPLP